MFQLFFQKRLGNSYKWGRKGEDVAVQFLKKLNYRILERNYVNKKGYRVGEIDIVAQEGKEIVFVEVKTRKRLGEYDIPPEMFVDKYKMRHLQQSSFCYLKENKRIEEKYRFDVIGVTYYGKGESVQIRHLKNVFL